MKLTKSPVSRKECGVLCLKELMMKKIIFLIIVLLLFTSFSPALAELKTFFKEYTYQASEFDSKATCRTLALDQVKRLLLEELGTYLESITEIKNFQLTNDSIKSITAGVVQTEVLEEKWDGKAYSLKVQIKADPDEVTKAIDKLLGKTALLNELMKERQKADEALREIAEIKKKAKDVQISNRKKLETQKEYENEVKKVGSLERWQHEFGIMSKGFIAYDNKNYDEAIYCARRILAIEGSEFKCDAFLLIGASYRGKEIFNEALDILNKSLKLCSSSESLIHTFLGETYRDMGKYEQAIIEFRKALPLLYDEKRRLAKQLPSPYLDNDPEVLRRSRDETDESIADTHGNIAAAILRKDFNPNLPPEQLVQWPKEFFSEMEEILKLKPNSIRNLRNWHKLGYGKFQEIVDWCNTLIKIRPNEAEIYYIRGCNYQSLKNYKQAIDDITKAIGFNPNVADYYERRGAAYAFLGIYNHAFKDFNRAIELNPTFAGAYYGRGLFGTNRQQAINDMKIAARLGHEGAQQFLRKQGIQW